MNPMETHGACSWLEYQGTDLPAAQDFYKNVLGWNMVDMPMEDGSTYPGILVGEQPIGGFTDSNGAGGGWLSYITVDDVDRRAEAARQAGGQILAEPFDVPGVGRISVLQDPLGARLALITYASQETA